MFYRDLQGLLREKAENKSEYTILIEETLKISKTDLMLYPNKEINAEDLKILEKRISEFEEGRPIQYILGKWEFRGREYLVSEGVLIPREDTFSVIELAESKLKGRKNLIFADLGSGSGCIAVSISAELDAEGYSVEKSNEARKYLAENLKMAENKVKILFGDMFSKEVLDRLPQLDLVISNPPYITASEMQELDKRVLKEPEIALFGGDDGLYFYREIAKTYKNKLKDGGLIAFEVGYKQADSVRKILEENGYRDIDEKKDLSNIRRAVCAIK